MTEGYSNNKVEICINYPTASKVRSAQRGGRALRRDKENPDKLALIMDIAFKRNNEKSDLEEIRANGQVLFQDIAGDVEMLSPVRLAKIADERESSRKRHQTEKEEKEALAPDRLFKTVVNVKELYDMRLTLLENDEKNTPARAKLASDLDMFTFQQRWSCRQNGKALENKSGLFKQLQQQQPELFTYVQAGSRQAHVIARENIPVFKQALAEMGYEVTDPEARTANVSRAKLASDLDIDTFQNRWSCRQNGKALSVNNKSGLFKQLQQQQPELFTYVKARSNQAHVIAKENISVFKQALAEMGYEALSPRDKLHEAQEKAAAAHTPAEKQKYLAAARKIFRALNPQLEKQNLCAACQQKISAGR